MSRSAAHDSSRPSPRPSPLSLPAGPATPEPRGVPAFGPLRVPGSRRRLHRALLRRRRAMAAGLAVTAAALAATGAGGATAETSSSRAAAPPGPGPAPRPVEMVSAPVRIADAATVRLLRRGDRVDVIAAPTPGVGGTDEEAEAWVVASGVRVAEIPRDREASAETAAAPGALVVLSVPRAAAAALAGAGAVSPLVVTLC